MKRRLRSKGQAMTEYLLLVALVALVVIAGVRFFGKRTKEGFQETGGVITGAVQEGVISSQGR